MKVKLILACVAGAPLLIGGTPQPVRLQPSSDWILDYAENSCRLIRTFGDGDQKTVLLFESPAPERMSMLAVGKPLESYLKEVPARFRPIEDQEPFRGSAVTAESGRPGILWSSVGLLPKSLAERLRKAPELKYKRGVRPPPTDIGERSAIRTARQAFASAATELEIDTRRGRPVILETGSVGEAIKMFDQCTRESLRDWGVDPAVEDKIVRPVWTADPSRWFSSDDYPRDMVVRGQESEVSARLLVDASGRVTGCTSLSHFDAPQFNKIVCDKFKVRARFEPAELADGTKVPSYYTATVIFQMPR